MHLFKLLVWLGILPKPVIKHGSTRIVWIFPKFAVKFPKTDLWKVIRILWKHKNNSWWVKTILFSKTKQFPCSIHQMCLCGFISNWGEFMFFLRNRKSTFIFPTYFSLFGIFNITPIGRESNKAPLQKLRECIPGGFGRHDVHHFAYAENFCKYHNRFCIWDYGSPETREAITRNQALLDRFSLEADLE